jgi:Tfp pilus assembly protein PilO
VLVERVRTLNGSTQKAMSAALIAAALVAGYGWILSPHVAYLQAVQQYEPIVKDMAAFKSVADMSVSAKRQELDTITTEFERLRSQFFTPVEATAFLGNLWTLAENAGCTVRSVDFLLGQNTLWEGSPADRRIATLHEAKLVLCGQYDDVVRLLEEFAQHSRKVKINSCLIDLTDDSASKVKCDMTIAIWVMSPEGGGNG